MSTRRTPSQRQRQRRLRGATLAEVIIGAGISSIVLIAAVGTFLVGIRSWVKGEANMEASTSSQKVLRKVSDELREAMDITVSTDGTKVSYTRPKRDVGGAFTNPMVADGVVRSIERSGTTLLLKTGSVTQTIAKGVLAREPAASSDYRIFTAPAGSVSRSLTIKVVASKPGFRGDAIVERSRETVYLRNVPQLSR